MQKCSAEIEEVITRRRIHQP